jgi:aspartate/methionine/tyrosine aminotransferase
MSDSDANSGDANSGDANSGDANSGRSLLTRQPSRRSAIDPFIVMDVMRAANARDAADLVRRAPAAERVIHMEVGQPGTPAPRLAREAALRAMESTTLGYTEALGLPELRQRIARLYEDWYGITLAPERVIVTGGSSAAFILAFLSLFDAGDTLALPAPGYPCYRHISSALGLKTHTLVTNERGRWMPTAGEIAELATSGAISGVLLASPANPSGTMLAPDRLAAIARTCGVRGASGSSPTRSITAWPMTRRRTPPCSIPIRPSSSTASRSTSP